jgi:hypothetical protein
VAACEEEKRQYVEEEGEEKVVGVGERSLGT